MYLENLNGTTIEPTMGSSQNTTHSFLDWDNSTSGNWSQDVSSSGLSPTSSFMLAYFSFRVLWSLLAVAGNTLTIVVVSKFEELHTNNNVLICSLAVADLLGGLVSPLLVVHHVLFDNPLYYPPFCLADKTLSLMSTSGNLFSILYISIDRYIFIQYPLRYNNMVTSTKIHIILAITWVYIVVSTPATMYFFNHLKVGMACKHVLFLHPAVYYGLLTPIFLVVTVLTIGFYCAIAKIAFKQSRAIAAATQPIDGVGTLASHMSKRITKMLGAILGVYLLSIMPEFFMTLLIRNKKTEFSLKLGQITALLYWANTWMNPIIYVWKVKEFKSPLKKLLNME